MNVRGRSAPLEHLPFASQRGNTAAEVPAIDSIVAAQAVFHPIRLLRLHRGLPVFLGGLEVIRMDQRVSPCGVATIRAGKIAKHPVHIVHRPIRPRGPYEARECIGNQAEAFLTLAKQLARQLSLGDVLHAALHAQPGGRYHPGSARSLRPST